MSWSEHVAEAAFKPIAGGYIFQAPGERPFGPPRFYQVNDAEKAELIALRRASAERWERLFKIVWTVLVALIAASVACFAFLGVIAGTACAVGAVVLAFAAVIAVRIFKAREIAPMLARLTPSTIEIPRREAVERTSDAIRRSLESEPSLAGTALGSWFEGWNAAGASGFALTVAKTQMRVGVQVESFMARCVYWIGLLVGLGIVGFWTYVIVHNGYARHDIMLAPATLAIALIVYVLGWAWRWLWTGRTDHLFAAARYMPSSRLDELRKNVRTLLALT